MADERDARLRELFARLAAAASEREAGAVEREIWSAWLATDDENVAPWIARGLAAMEARDLAAALQAFDRVVELAPDYAEGWNKRATLHWLRGAYQESVADIARTLALEPRHFGALSGLGVIMQQFGEEKLALEAFRRALAVNPHLQKIPDFVKTLTEKVEGRDI